MRDPMAVKIGDRIRLARGVKKWKLRELAAYSGLDLTIISNYELGDRMPGPAEILALATALGESPAFLMGLADDPNPIAARNSAEAALLELYRTVDPPDRKKTLDRLGALALLKRDAVQDAELEHLSAKGKPARHPPKAAPPAPAKRRRATEAK